jgi:Chaperone of endosialidase
MRALGGGGGITGQGSSAVANTNGSSGAQDYIFGISASASSNLSNVEYSGFESIYGIFASAIGNDATNGDIYAGFFDGNIYATALFTPSDENIKTNIATLESSLDKVMAIDVVTYEYNQETTGDMNLPNGQQIGYTAQNMGEFYPSLINHATHPAKFDDEGNILSESFGFDAVNYTGMVPVLHKAIQEQQNLINSLSETVNALSLQLESCCADTKSQESTPDHSVDVKLSNEAQAVLFQNTPNPHKGECVIRYFLPESTSIAEIQFFDVQGSILKVVPLNQKGLGLINLDAKDLANGIYTYALIVDGIAIDMKKMVKE